MFVVNVDDFVNGRVTSLFMPAAGPMKMVFDNISETLKSSIIARLNQMKNKQDL